ncbi:class I SAM-dependent methyltransferase [Desulfobacterales bacterium HSG17]|nr:class I SAM-dependent methyltransferase [Desulfobacterales bacterium HSG17]
MDNLKSPSYIESIYTDKVYVQTKQTNHFVSVPEYDQPVTQYFLQAMILKKYLPEEPSILDIGCFDGKLLQEFQKVSSKASLHGFDIDEQRRDLVPEDIIFWSEDLVQVTETFDLICLSHSIQYILDIPALFENLKRLLKKNGIIFIQVPNLLKNYYAILYGDLYYYYTPEVIEAIFSFFGFGFKNIDKKGWFDTDIVGAAMVLENSEPKKVPDNNVMSDCLDYFKDMEQGLHKIKNIKDRRIGILGTTINAGFASLALDSSLDYFIDENPSKQGSFFHDKPVRHPKTLTNNDVVVLPYGQAGNKIKKRFDLKYMGKFILV